MVRTRRLVSLLTMFLFTTAGLAVISAPAHAANGTVSGTISAANRDVARTRVSFYQWNGSGYTYASAVTTTYAQPGTFNHSLPPGTYTARVESASGTALPYYYGDGMWRQPTTNSGPGTFVVPDGGNVSVNLAYPEMREISGTYTIDGKTPGVSRGVYYYRWEEAAKNWYMFQYVDADWKGRYDFASVPEGTYLTLIDRQTDEGWIERFAGVATNLANWTAEVPKTPEGPAVFTVGAADQIRNYDWNGTNPAPVALTAPSIPATGKVGTALTVTPGAWTETPVLSYQWMRDGAAIAGATAASYTPTAADAGASLTVAVGATQAGNAPGSATTNASEIGKVSAAVKVKKKVKKRKIKITIRASGLSASGKVVVRIGKAKIGKAKVRKGRATVKVSEKKLRKALRGRVRGKAKVKVTYSGNDSIVSRTVKKKVVFL